MDVAELLAIEAAVQQHTDLSRYTDAPARFAREQLSIRVDGDPQPVKLWKAQRAIARSVATSTRTAVRSGHKTGKSIGAVAIALWWVLTRPRGQVILTSSASRQVKTILWKELRRIYNASGGSKRWGAVIPKDPATGVVFDEMRTIYGFTTDDAERMQGFSGDQLLFVVDEASGFDDAIWEAIQGNLAGGGRVLATGNPTRTAGWFYDAFHSKRALWSTHHVDSRSSPNVTQGRPVFPGLAGPAWVAEMVEEYGGGDVDVAERHPVFAVRVAGNFPAQADTAVVSLGSVESALERWPTMEPRGALEIGVDVARFGSDDSAIQPVRGLYAYPQTVVNGYDNVELAGKVLEVARSLRSEGDSAAPVVKVDAGGNGGGVVDILRRSTEVTVIPVDAGEASDVENRDGGRLFVRRRDELWWAVRDWLDQGGALPEDPRRDAELLSPTYGFDASLRIRVEAKDAVKKRIARSPDRADALCLAVWRQGLASMPLVHVPDQRTRRPRLARRGNPWR